MFPRGIFWAAVFGAIGGILVVMCLNAAVSHPREGEKGFCVAAVCGALGGIFTVLCKNGAWRADEAEAGIQFVVSRKEANEHDERDP